MTPRISALADSSGMFSDKVCDRRNDLKIGVAVNDSRAVAQRYRGNQTVIDAADRLTSAPGGPVDRRRTPKIDRIIDLERR